MRIVIDGLPIRGDNSLSIVSEHLLSAWQQLGADDELHLVIRAGASIDIPDSVTVHEVTFGRLPMLSRLRAQNVVLRRLCRSLQADVLFGILPNTAVDTVAVSPCRDGLGLPLSIAARQFSRKTLALRQASYAIGFRQADGVACISGRTRRDLLTFHPKLSRVPARVTHLGADHVDDWTATTTTTTTGTSPYAIAFGHFGNKNVDLVVQAWAELQRLGTVLPLRIVGVSEGNRPALESQLAQAGVAEVVSISPWLPEPAFHEQFASSSLVVFPSDFEGFGLPAVEALRLGIPVVITPDQALLEVTGGHATVVDGEGPAALARAVETARQATPGSIAAGRRYAASFTWANCARSVRALLAEVVVPQRVPVVQHRSRLRIMPARLAAALATGLLVIGGATAVSYALGSSSSRPPAGGSGTTTVPSASRSKDSGSSGTSPDTRSDVRGAAGAAAGDGSGSDPPAGAAAGTGNRRTSGPTGTTSPAPVTVPPMPTPPVTVPSVTVPSVTVPTSVCSTITVPCAVTVPGQSCQCP